MKNIVLLLSLISTLYSFSQENSHTIDIENGKCLENAIPTTIGSVKCEQTALVSWKVELSNVLKQLKTNSKLSNFDLLEDSQAKWLAFHQANIKFYYAYYQKQYQGGSMARAAVVSYEKRHLRERVLYLLELYAELHE